MRLRISDAPYLANKIAIDLNKSSFVVMKHGLEPIVQVAQTIIQNDIMIEMGVDAKVKELLNQNEEEIEFVSADSKQLFWMIKRKIAPELGLILDKEERFGNIAHLILDEIWNEDLMDYSVAESIIKNVIVKAMLDYVKRIDEIKDSVYDKIRAYKQKLVPGSEEFEIVETKLLEDELRKRGML